MKQVVLLVFCVGVTLGRPQTPAAQPQGAAAAPKANVTIVKDVRNSNDGKGNYNYDIELSDGTKLIQMGGTMPPPAGGNDTDPVLVIKGSYSYVDPQGKTVEIKYVADDHGFQATGDSIPTVPSKSNSGSAAPVSAAPAAAPAPLAPAASSAAPASVASAVQPETAPLQTQASSIASAPSAIA